MEDEEEVEGEEKVDEVVERDRLTEMTNFLFRRVTNH